MIPIAIVLNVVLLITLLIYACVADPLGTWPDSFTEWLLVSASGLCPLANLLVLIRRCDQKKYFRRFLGWNMNKKQKIVYWSAVIIIVLMLLFPPNAFYGLQYDFYTFDEQGVMWQHPRSDLPYGFLLAAPDINGKVLLAQCAIVIIVAGSLIYAFKDKKPKDEQN